MRKLIRAILVMFLFLFVLSTVNTHAYYGVLSDRDAESLSRKSFNMRGTEGIYYNLYIIGENERGNTFQNYWKGGRFDTAYSCCHYTAYISESTNSSAFEQSENLFEQGRFGRARSSEETINLTDGNVYLMENTNGNPDILVTSEQMSSSFVDYRFFIIKEGKLTAMKVKYSDGEIGVTTIGRPTRPYIMQDGTIAIPKFRQRQFTPGEKYGNYTAVYMPDYTNCILISAYLIWE